MAVCLVPCKCLKLDETEGTPSLGEQEERVAFDPSKDFWLLLLYTLSATKSGL